MFISKTEIDTLGHNGHFFIVSSKCDTFFQEIYIIVNHGL